jgi:opacity protein-like surface antigen
MKRITKLSILIFGLLLSFNIHAQAQDLKLGGGLVLGTGVFEFDDLDNDFGLRAEGIYSVNEKVRTSADITFFFPKSEGNIDVSLLGVNLNAHYIFYNEDAITAYGLGGLNIAIINVDTPSQTVPGFGTFGGSDSETEVALNLGGGVEYMLDFAELFGEIKFGGLAGDADQFVLAAGLRFGI